MSGRLLPGGAYDSDWVARFYSMAGIWWGRDPQGGTVHDRRIGIVEKFGGRPGDSILELGSGGGATAAAFADLGYSVCAVDISDRSLYATELASLPRAGGMEVIQADFLELELARTFDFVTCWEGFGIGDDSLQRCLLGKIASSWLRNGGAAIMDVFHPYGAIKAAGSEKRYKPLVGVPGSVEMINRTYYDPINAQWIDEWCPVDDPDQALAQALRCYTPKDLALLVEGTGLVIESLECRGTQLDLHRGEVCVDSPLLDAEHDYTYLAVMRKKG